MQLSRLSMDAALMSSSPSLLLLLSAVRDAVRSRAAHRARAGPRPPPQAAQQPLEGADPRALQGISARAPTDLVVVLHARTDFSIPG